MTADRPTVGIDLGGTKTLALMVGSVSPLSVLSERQAPTPGSGAEVIDSICTLVRSLVDEGGEVVAIGIGLAALLGPDHVAWEAPNAKALIGLDVGGEVERRLRIPTVVDNDANCAARAEQQLGSGRSAQSLLLVTLGTGIGGGIVLDGSLYRGHRGSAGEPGHMVVDPSGPLCPCGQRGCWERFASGSGLAWLAREAVDEGRAASVLRAAGGRKEEVTGELVVELAASGDGAANEVVDTFAGWVALGIANLVNIFDPEAIVIGGGLAPVGDMLIERVRVSYLEHPLASRRMPPVEIALTGLGPRAGALGAALMASTAHQPPGKPGACG